MELVRQVADAFPAAFMLVDASGAIALVNRLAARMFGYTEDDMLKMAAEALLPPRLVGDAGRRSDGSEFPVDIARSPFSCEGKSMVLLGITDVSARSRAEAENARSRHELAQQQAEMEAFAQAATHDLKAPLRALGLLADWITDDVAATAAPKTLDNLTLLKNRVLRLQMLLDGLLAHARAGHETQAADYVDMGELVADIATMLVLPAGFSVTCDGSLGHLHTHRSSIRTVLENLIGNAIKHHDRAAGRIAVSMRRSERGAEIRVTDDGPGIAPRNHQRIFIIFQTLASPDPSAPGGIGLAIVKKEVERHGGTIRVESAPPARGASFVFTWQESPT